MRDWLTARGNNTKMCYLNAKCDDKKKSGIELLSWENTSKRRERVFNSRSNLCQLIRRYLMKLYRYLFSVSHPHFRSTFRLSYLFESKQTFETFTLWLCSSLTELGKFQKDVKITNVNICLPNDEKTKTQKPIWEGRNKSFRYHFRLQKKFSSRSLSWRMLLFFQHIVIKVARRRRCSPFHFFIEFHSIHSKQRAHPSHLISAECRCRMWCEN